MLFLRRPLSQVLGRSISRLLTAYPVFSEGNHNVWWLNVLCKEADGVTLSLMFSHSHQRDSIRSNSGHVHSVFGARSSVVVKALCYEPEGRGFETR
jgi:hypothetical protein